MYEKVSFTVTALTLFNLIIVTSFTIGSAQLCPNNFNKTQCDAADDYNWDTISEMITRDDRVRNAFAGSLVISAVILYFIISLILARLDFYYNEIRTIGDLARLCKFFEEFKQQLSVLDGACIHALLRVLNKENYDPAAITRSAQHSTPHRSYSFWSPLSFYDMKKKAVWLVYYGAMFCYLGFGVISTDVSTVDHTNLAKGAFALLMVVVLGLTHLSWNHMAMWHIGQIVTVLSLSGAVLAGAMYVVTTKYWLEYVLVACLHVCVLAMCVFHVTFAYKNVSISRYGGGDYRVDVHGPRVQCLSLRL